MGLNRNSNSVGRLSRQKKLLILTSLLVLKLIFDLYMFFIKKVARRTVFPGG